MEKKLRFSHGIVLNSALFCYSRILSRTSNKVYYIYFFFHNYYELDCLPLLFRYVHSSFSIVFESANRAKLSK